MKELLIDPDWIEAVGTEFDKPYFQKLQYKLDTEMSQGKAIFPARDRWFAAFNETPLSSLKLVLIGQDPYPTPGVANGLCFSIEPECSSMPASLRNIYKAIEQQTGAPSIHDNGDLSGWANQGVLLLNDTLTVEGGNAGAHMRFGWNIFTDAVVNAINRETEGVVFLLWGGFASRKGAKIDRDKHLVLESPHPSPLSAYRGFFENGHFVKANEYLLSKGKQPIAW